MTRDARPESLQPGGSGGGFLLPGRSGPIADGPLLSSVAHDLRNRLNAIAIRVALGREPSIGDDKRLEQLDVIDRLLKNVRSYIDDISELAALMDARPTPPLALEPCDPQRLVDDAFEREEGAAAAASIRLVNGIAEGAPVVRADASRTVHLLCNLVAETVTRFPEGGELTITAERSGDHVQFRLVPATPEREAPQRRSSPTPTDRLRASLPFAIARGLAEAQGGRADVEPGPGGVPSATFTLPAID